MQGCTGRKGEYTGMILQAKQVSFQYKENSPMILQNISFEVGEGERVGLRGKSGIGKTTLCRLLAGYEKPRSGEILLDGRPITDYRGYCRYRWYGSIRSRRLIRAAGCHTVLEEGDGITEDIIKGLGIEEAWKMRFPAELSGGEQQRFCIARALGKGTRISLADEDSTMLGSDHPKPDMEFFAGGSEAERSWHSRCKP